MLKKITDHPSQCEKLASKDKLVDICKRLKLPTSGTKTFLCNGIRNYIQGLKDDEDKPQGKYRKVKLLKRDCVKPNMKWISGKGCYEKSVPTPKKPETPAPARDKKQGMTLAKAIHTAEHFFDQVAYIVLQALIDNRSETTILTRLKEAILNFTNLPYNETFCDAIQRKSLIPPQPDTTKKLGGTASAVGPILRNTNGQDYVLRGMTTQMFRPSGEAGGFDPFEQDMIVKRTKPILPEDIAYNIRASFQRSELFVRLPDPFFEVMTNSLLSMLYDAGQALHVTKMFGFYGCRDAHDRDANVYYLLAERNNVSLMDWINTTPATSITELQLAMFVFQVIFTLCQVKTFCKFRHLDLHTANVMIADLKGSSHFQGQPLDTVKQISYVINIGASGEKTIVTMPTNGQIAKIIDFGYGAFSLGDTTFLLNSNIHQGKIATENSNPRNNDSGFYQVDILFFLLNLCQACYHSKHWKRNRMVAELVKACTAHLSFPDTLPRETWPVVATGEIKTTSHPDIAGRNIWDCYHQWYWKGKGILVNNTKAFGYSSVNLRGLFGTKEHDDTGKTIHSSYFPSRIASFFSKYFKKISVKQTRSMPSLHEITLFIKPKDAKDMQKLKWMPRHSAQIELMETCAKSSSSSCQHKDEAFFQQGQLATTVPSLTNNEFSSTLTGSSSSKLGEKLYSLQTPMTLKDYRWFDHSWHAGPKTLHTPTNVHIVNISAPYRLVTNVGSSLWDVSKAQLSNMSTSDRKSFVAVNGNYFIVPTNLNDQYSRKVDGSHLEVVDTYKPIGFFHQSSKIKGSLSSIGIGTQTLMEIPLALTDDFAFITYLARDNKWKVQRYSTVLKDYPRYVKDIKQYIAEIDTRSSSGEKKDAVQIKAKTLTSLPFEADLAFLGGPIYILDGKEVFSPNDTYVTDSKIRGENGRTIESNKPYAISSHMMDNRKWKSKHKNDMSCPYGDRCSNYLLVHNIMLFYNDGSIGFMLIEGRGFDTMGVTREHVLQYLRKVPNVKSAVSLDGGFSANAVMYNKEDPLSFESLRYTLQDPEKRPLGMSMMFIK